MPSFTDVEHAAIEWKKNDRIVIKHDNNEYYVGTITRFKGTKLYVRFDDGDGKWYGKRSKFIAGRTKYRRGRVRHFTEKEVKDIIDELPEAKSLKTPKHPIVKKSTGLAPIEPLKYAEERKRREEKEKKAEKKLLKKQRKLATQRGDEGLQRLAQLLPNIDPADEDSIYKKHPGSLAVAVVANPKTGKAKAFTVHPNDLIYVKNWNRMSHNKKPAFYILVGAHASRKWSEKLVGASISNARPILFNAMIELLKDGVAYASHRAISWEVDPGYEPHNPLFYKIWEKKGYIRKIIRKYQ